MNGMWLRRAALALAAVAVAAYLILGALPPPPLPTQPPPPPNTTLAAPPPPAPLMSLSSTVKSTAANNSVVYVKDVYAAGHDWPHPELCPALGAHLKLLILITTAPSHSHAREAIRLTWGHYTQRSDVSIGFVIGQPPEKLLPDLEKEDALYNDIILGRFVDSYSNLTLKTISMLEWADTYCPKVTRVLKTDDDMFINVGKLLQFLETKEKENNTIWGRVVKHWAPKRTVKSKYYLPPQQFPYKVLPDFATGPAYVITSDAIRSLLSVIPNQKYLRLEDVFLTGVVANAAKVKKQHTPAFYNRAIRPTACSLRHALSIHMVRYSDQLELWKKLLDDTIKCPK